MQDLSLTVNVWGHLSGEFGLGEGARCTVRSLQAAGIRVQLHDIPLNTHSNNADLLKITTQQTGESRSAAVDLVHTNPNVVQATDEISDQLNLKAPLRIGFWAWELEDFPTGWDASFSRFDQIWCPSSFTASSLGSCSPIPVTPLPHLIDWSWAQRIRKQREANYQRGNRPITCFFACDLWSTLGRKNPEGVIDAFQEAFPITNAVRPQQREARLVLKLSSTDQFPNATAKLLQKINNDSRITLITRHLSRAAMQQIWNEVDLLIHLHRAEGFGLLMAEAMAAGVAVIATGYSGNLDYMHTGSAALIPYTLSTIERGEGDYQPGWHWAEPDLEEAAKQIQLLATNDSLRYDLSQRGYLHAKERLSPSRLAKQVKQRLGCLLAWAGRAELLANLNEDHPLKQLEPF